MDKPIAIVTGGSRGIGKAIVEKLISNGFFVIFTYLQNKALAQSICAAYDQQETVCEAFECNAAELKNVQELTAIIKNKYGSVDVLVNNAGIRDNQLFLLSNENEWWQVIKNNLGGVVNFSKAILPLMMQKRSGKIINITSISGQRGTIGQSAYSASKAAIVAFSKSICREFAGYGISINCISPGLIETDMIGSLKPEIVAAHLKNIPLKRMGQSEEIAELVGLLASGKVSYLFGQEITIDGGVTM